MRCGYQDAPSRCTLLASTLAIVCAWDAEAGSADLLLLCLLSGEQTYTLLWNKLCLLKFSGEFGDLTDRTELDCANPEIEFLIAIGSAGRNTSSFELLRFRRLLIGEMPPSF